MDGAEEVRYGIIGGAKRRPQVRKIRASNRWTYEIREGFLDHLTLSANVRASAQAVNMGFQGAYRLRARDPEFALGWQEAVNQAYELLELEMLHRARFGKKETTIVRDRKQRLVSEKVVHSYSDGHGARLLARHHMRQAELVQAALAQAALNPPVPPAPVDAPLSPQETALRLDYLREALTAMHARMPDAPPQQGGGTEGP